MRLGVNRIAVAALMICSVGDSRMLGAGIEPAWEFIPRDFKSLASTGFATRACERASGQSDTDPDEN